jgi:hypothetical protein
MNALTDLRPGDIMLGPIGGLVGLGVGLGQLVLGEAFRSGALSVRHAGIVVRGAEWSGGILVVPPLLAQAMPSGAEIVEMNEGHWTERHAYVRLLEDYAGQALDAAGMAAAMVREGVAYSWASYLFLAAWKLTGQSWLARWIDRRRPPRQLPLSPSGREYSVRLPREAICSVFAEQSWTLVGKCVVRGTRPQAVTPGMLADTLAQYEGATWCRPRPGRGSARVWTI